MPSPTETGFTQLYSDHHPWLRGWLHGKLGNISDAADLAQDTFLRLLASHRRPAQLGSEPRALLVQVAKGLMIDRWRHQHVERAYLEALAHLPDAEAPSPETQALILEALTRVDTMLSRMPPRTREIFLLAQLDGLTLKQIAEQTGTPVITVRRHIHRALMACMTLD